MASRRAPLFALALLTAAACGASDDECDGPLVRCVDHAIEYCEADDDGRMRLSVTPCPAPYDCAEALPGYNVCALGGAPDDRCAPAADDQSRWLCDGDLALRCEGELLTMHHLCTGCVETDALPTCDTQFMQLCEGPGDCPDALMCLDQDESSYCTVTCSTDEDCADVGGPPRCTDGICT